MPVIETQHAWGREVVQDDSGPHPLRVYAQRRRHTAELLLDARRFAEREHVVQGDLRLTFAEHEDAVHRAAGMLLDHGVTSGDHVLILGQNSIAWVVAYWATLRVDAVAVLGNQWWTEAETQTLVGRIAPRLALVDAALLPRLPANVPVVELADLLQVDGPVPDLPDLTAGEHEPAVIMFSAGTTGMPKAVVLPHRAMVANIQNVLNVSRRLPSDIDGNRPGNVALHTLPLFHAGGLQTLAVNLMAGAKMVFLPDRFSAAEGLRLIEAERVTHWAGVPTMLSRMMDHQDFVTRDTSSLRSIVMAGSVVPPVLRERAAAAFASSAGGGAVNYGLTESGGTVCAASAGQASERSGTVGWPVAVAEIRIAPEPGFSVGEGEVLVRSPQVMLGYLGDAATSGPVDGEGWLHTGDLGRLDADGWLYLVGRKKDIIIRGGENIASPMVEARLREHPDVLDAAVVGLPHDDLGEEVGAAVVLRPGAAADADALRAFAAEVLARFAVPTRWWLRTEPLPTTAVGKVLKRTVAHEFPP